MAKQDINLGTQPTGVGGDTNRSANVKINANLTELYKAMGGSLNGGNGSVLPTTGLPIANGGTGATTAETALSNLGGVPKAGDGSPGGILGYGYGGISSTNYDSWADVPRRGGFFKVKDGSPATTGTPTQAGTYGNNGILIPRHTNNYHNALFFPYFSGAANSSIIHRLVKGSSTYDAVVYKSDDPYIYNQTTAEYPNVYIESTGELKRSTQNLKESVFAYQGDLSTVDNLNDLDNRDNTSHRGVWTCVASATPTLDKNFPEAGIGGSLLVAGSTYGVSQLYLGRNGIIHFRNSSSSVSGAFLPWAKQYSTRNTTVDSNGFIKSASPIIELYADRIELNDEAKQQAITFEKLGVGDYLIKGSSGFAQEGWYVEQPKDANGNVYHAVVYDTLENGDISIKTYEQKIDGVKVVADLDKPVDVKENRFISIRLQELPQPEFEEAQPDPTITDYQGNPAPSRLHELENGIWVISEENAATLERERLEKMPDLTRRQFRLVLVLNGYDLSQIETLINSIEDPMQRQITMIEWQDATTFHRTNPSLIIMAGLMELDTATVDQLWLQASTL